jgi:hypothetical protein
MLTCYREFTTAQARIEPTTARSEIDRFLADMLVGKAAGISAASI